MSRSKRPKVIDLFAGAGGFSLGATRAGFAVAAAIDLDPYAFETHTVNFPKCNHDRRNVKKLSGDQLRDIAGINGQRVDGLIGGPPCQGFSTMGWRRKNDARNKLFYHFFRLVSEVKPLFFVVENVPGILDEKYDVKRFADKAEVSGFLATKHTPEVAERFDRLEPGKMDAISKFPRLKWDGTCPTLRAGTASDRGSYQAARPIHPSRPRVITTREAARLQGFPDWFVFHPTKWHSFREIGNSVSPLVAEAALSVIAKQFAVP
jgi:site-specific DNA-cytosine methylase